MIKWTKQSKTVTKDGTRIVYDGEGTYLVIISDKRHIPHAAGRDGFWDHTTFILHHITEDWSKEFQTLKDAKEYAEKWMEEAQS